MSGVPPRLSFPDSSALARVFFEEGIRHLEDAHVLHKAGRHPAAVASAMKSAELGVKAIVVLDGAMGWWDRIFTTHSPLGDINALPIFQYHIVTLGGYRRTLVAEVMEMEKLAPARPALARVSSGNALDADAQRNPEYPFLSYQTDPVTGSSQYQLGKPSTQFLVADSRKYCDTAWHLLTGVMGQYAAVSDWRLTIPVPL